MLAEKDNKILAWQDLCSAHVKRAKILKLKNAALRESLGEAKAGELHRNKNLKLLGETDIAHFMEHDGFGEGKGVIGKAREGDSKKVGSRKEPFGKM